MSAINTKKESHYPIDRFLVLPSFLSVEEQKVLSSSAVEAHLNFSSAENKTDIGFTLDLPVNGTASRSLNLGLEYCGAPLTSLPVAVALSFRALQHAASIYNNQLGCPCISISLQKLSSYTLTGVALLYGPCGKMTPHFDSPTQPEQKEEWLVMFSMGNDVLFQVNDRQIRLSSGDALIMDAMSVLHGVVSILSSKEGNDPAIRLGLSPGSRLGVLLWQSSPKKERIDNRSLSSSEFDVGGLFESDNDI
mmetsp:Transcript_255/g.371  ORF Transcript_255/g.371 Transcript_255/m.371 type:complete len:249 (-) Transcript_255:474-1220(-)